MTKKYRVNTHLDCVLVSMDPNTRYRLFHTPGGIPINVPDETSERVQEQTTDDPLGLVGCEIFVPGRHEPGPFRYSMLSYSPANDRYVMFDHLPEVNSKTTFRTRAVRESLEREGTTVTKTVTQPATVSAPPPPAIHVETLRPNRNQEVPDSVMAAALDRGERAVRRSMREWPYGKRLDHRSKRENDLVTVEWFWTEVEAT